jgi:uncharacterized membrane protein
MTFTIVIPKLFARISGADSDVNAALDLKTHTPISHRKLVVNATRVLTRSVTIEELAASTQVVIKFALAWEPTMVLRVMSTEKFWR